LITVIGSAIYQRCNLILTRVLLDQHYLGLECQA